VCALGSLALLVACGDAGGPTPTIQGLSITPGTNAVTVGHSESYSATARMSDSSSKTVTATWSSDNTSVLTIDASGRAQGLQPGLATIIATYEGVTKTLLIHVVPNYEGMWAGDYTVTRCVDSGDFAEICGSGSEDVKRGDLLPIELALTQNGTVVSGTLWMGQVTGPLTGNLDDGGSFRGTASLTFTLEGYTVTMSVSPLTLRVDGDRLGGSLSAEMTGAGAQGSWIIGGDLHSVVRTSATGMPLGLEQQAFGSLREAILALKRR
jgi:hypothetical protein